MGRAPVTETRYGRQPLADVLEQRGITQLALSRAVDVPPVRISNVVCGRARPRLDIAARIARELGVPIEQLFTEAMLVGHAYVANGRAVS